MAPIKVKFRTTRDILIPKGSPVVFVARMNKVVERTATAFVKAGPDMHYEWLMYFDDALAAGLIEEMP